MVPRLQDSKMTKFRLRLAPQFVRSRISVGGVPLEGVRRIAVEQDCGIYPILTIGFITTSGEVEICGEGVVRVGDISVPDVLARKIYQRLKEHFEPPSPPEVVLLREGRGLDGKKGSGRYA